MDQVFIENLIAKHEGRRATVYKDTRGILTIGIGFNLEDGDAQDICDHFGLNIAALKNGTALLTNPQIDEIFQYQFTEATSEAMVLLPNFTTMPDKVQAVVVDLIFNMGPTRFSEFHDTIQALKSGKWVAAAQHLKESLWYTQVGDRAVEDCGLLMAA